MTDQLREEFEAAIKAKCPHWSLLSDGVGGYHTDKADAAWIGWQAARASAPAASPSARLAGHAGDNDDLAEGLA